MFSSMKSIFGRRELFRRGGLLAAPAFLGGARPASAAAPLTAGKLHLGSGIYQSIGVRPRPFPEVGEPPARTSDAS